MQGALVNAGVVLVCGIIGVFIKKVDRFEVPIKNVLGLAVLLMGIEGVVSGLRYTDTLLFVLCLVIGTIIGEIVNIEDKFKAAGDFLAAKFSKKGENDGKFSEGFVKTSLIYCVGAMAVVGSFQSGISGDHTLLYVKSALDGVSSVVFASAMGLGVAFSSIPILLYEGALTLLAGYIAPFVTDDALTALGAVGNVLICAIGLDMLGIVRVGYANMLPAMFLPIIYYYILHILFF